MVAKCHYQSDIWTDWACWNRKLGRAPMKACFDVSSGVATCLDGLLLTRQASPWARLLRCDVAQTQRWPLIIASGHIASKDIRLPGLAQPSPEPRSARLGSCPRLGPLALFCLDILNTWHASERLDVRRHLLTRRPPRRYVMMSASQITHSIPSL